MSILAASDATTQPSLAAQYGFVAFLLLIGLLIGHAAGVFRRGSIRGPERLSRNTPRGTVFVVLVSGVLFWLATQMAIGLWARVRHGATASTRPFDISSFTVADYALLATVPGIIGLLVLVGGDLLIGGTTLRRLGLTLQQLVPGIRKGVVGILILLPVIFFASMLVESLYEFVGYEHPSEHDLLRVMNEATNPIHRVLLIVGATVVAPAFEEILFRGHLQTLLVAWIDDILPRRREPVAVGQGFAEVVTGPDNSPAAESAGPLAQSEPAAPPEGPRPVWWKSVRLWAVVVCSIQIMIYLVFG